MCALNRYRMHPYAATIIIIIIVNLLMQPRLSQWYVSAAGLAMYR
jgi:hypothetical protein